MVGDEIVVKVGDGRQVKFAHSPGQEDDRDGRQTWWRLGDRSSQRLFPQSYLPADPGRSFVGRPATVVTYHDRQRRRGTTRIVWIDTGPQAR